MKFLILLSTCLWLGMSEAALADNTAATIAALRISGTVAGGLIPPSAPEFAQMVNFAASGDYYNAALTAARSAYFPRYLGRRLAKQMMNPSLTASGVLDNDATAFLIANMIGSGGIGPNISGWWSNNYTCEVNVAGGIAPVHIGTLSASQLAAIDYRTDLVCTPGQSAADPASGSPVAIPAKHIGGYVTLSSAVGDTSLAQYGATAGTNLRYIEAVWEISTGLSLTDAASVDAMAQEVPRFVPENDSNFVQGHGQPACLSCHGGGMSSLNHGYSTVADLFNYDPKLGFTYISQITTNSQKSLGSNMGSRPNVAKCDMTDFTVCNPDSLGADPNQSWDVSTTWAQSGLLAKMGWNGPTSGQGLNSLGAAIGKANIVYTNLVQRVLNEVCPLGSFSAQTLASFATNVQASQDIRTLIANIAADPSCH